jgi:hypothetical protein
MKKLYIVFFIGMLSVACHFRKSPVVTEKPAPLQPAGKEVLYNFDSETANQMPANFHGVVTGSGSPGDWKVMADVTAASQPNVLAQLSPENTGNRFPLAVSDEGAFKDLDVSVRFKPISGSEDQAAGVVWRYKDADNYYIVRANALENNVVPYKVENGNRTDLPLKGEGQTYGKKANVPSQQWSDLRVRVAGNLFEVFLNGEKLYEVEDETFKEAGKIGVWTKADSVTYFDNVRVIAR